MRTQTKASVHSLIAEYGLHEYLDGDDARVNLAPLEMMFPIRRDDLDEFDLAGLVLLPDGGELAPENPARVTIHDALDDSTARLIYAHEIGHAVLGHEGSLRLSEMDTWFSDRAEREAWQVAAQLLIPHQVLWLSAQQGWSLDQVAAICDVPLWLVEMYPR